MIAEQTSSESEQGERMNFGHYLQQSIQVLQLDSDAIRDVSKDEDALLPALIFFAVSGLAIGAGRYSFETLIFGPILVTLLSFVFVGLLNILSRLFGGTARFLDLYRPLGLADHALARSVGASRSDHRTFPRIFRARLPSGYCRAHARIRRQTLTSTSRSRRSTPRRHQLISFSRVLRNGRLASALPCALFLSLEEI